MSKATCIFNDGRHNVQVNYGGTKEQAIAAWRADVKAREARWAYLLCEHSGEVLATSMQGRVMVRHASTADVHAYRVEHGCGLYEAKRAVSEERRAEVNALIRQTIADAQTLDDMKGALIALIDHNFPAVAPRAPLMSEVTEEWEEVSYGEQIRMLKGERPAWVVPFSDRTACALLREGFNSLEELKAAVDNGLSVERIPNVGRKEVNEVWAVLDAMSAP